MSEPFLSRMFLRKKNSGKGLNKLKPSQKDQEGRIDIRDKGIDGLGIGAVNSSKKEAITIDGLDDHRDQLDCLMYRIFQQRRKYGENERRRRLLQLSLEKAGKITTIFRTNS